MSTKAGRARDNEIVELVNSTLKSALKEEAFINALVEALTDQMKTLIQPRIEELLAKLHQVEQKLSVVEKDKQHLLCENNLLNSRLDALEHQVYHSNKMWIYGVPEDKNSEPAVSIKNLVKEKMDVSLMDSDIITCYRVKPRNQHSSNRQSPIILKLSSHKIFNQLLYARKKLKNTRITISEELSKNKIELMQAVRAKFGKENSWVWKGNIFVNSNGAKQVIRNHDDMVKL